MITQRTGVELYWISAHFGTRILNSRANRISVRIAVEFTVLKPV